MPSPPTWRFIVSRPSYLAAFGFGAGLSPVAPGTVGTSRGFPLYRSLSAFLPTAGVLISLAALVLLGVYWCGATGRAIGVADHPGIVWDEIVAMELILSFVPAHPLWCVTAFLLFRPFDVLKPWPICLVDKNLRSNRGVIHDEFVAAVFSVLLLMGFDEAFSWQADSVRLWLW